MLRGRSCAPLACEKSVPKPSDSFEKQKAAEDYSMIHTVKKNRYYTKKETGFDIISHHRLAADG